MPLVLAWIARRYRRRRNRDEPNSLPEWLDREFDAHTGRLKGMAAAIEILLPIAAVAFGMTIFALVRYLDLAV